MGSKKKDAVSKLVIEGELTIYTAAELKQKLADALDGAAAVEIDLAQVGEIDTAGLQLLLLAQREGTLREKNVIFSQPSQAVLDCWQLCNLGTAFGVDDGGAPADAA